MRRDAYRNDIRNALKSVKYPGYSRDIVSFGLVKKWLPAMAPPV